MLHAYINSPQPKVVIHPDPSCPRIQMNAKPGQRVVRINVESLSEEIGRFKNKEYRFAADATNNDMWIEVDFGDADFEAAIIEYVRRLIGKH
jgi:hypothetical protein